MSSVLTIPQMYALARQAGLNPARAAVAAAVGMAESSGRAAVTSPNPDGGTNVGIWQLDTPGGKGSGYTIAQLQDPATNAKVMAAGTNGGQDWSAWETYVTGAYRQYMGQAAAASGQESSGGSGWISSVLKGIGDVVGVVSGGSAGSGGGLGGLLSIPSDITNFFTTAEKFVKALMWLVNPVNWVRLAAGAAGVLLAGAGIFVLAKAI